MDKKRDNDSNYCIHNFMSTELMLRGGELHIFAIIYSFTKGSYGSYFGTQEYLASCCGISISTVKRSLLKLLNKGYITECRHKNRRAYKTTEKAEPQTRNTDKSMLSEDFPDECSDSPIEDFDITDESLYTDLRPRFVFYPVGKEGIVYMTAAQYKSLLKLVEPEILRVYTTKLEQLILNKGYRTFNPYKTIRKWIYEDAST